MVTEAQVYNRVFQEAQTAIASGACSHDLLGTALSIQSWSGLPEGGIPYCWDNIYRLLRKMRHLSRVGTRFDYSILGDKKYTFEDVRDL